MSQIIIIRPEATLTTEKGKFVYEQAFKDTISLKNLKHFGSLNQRPGAEFEMNFCGGSLIVSEIPLNHQDNHYKKNYFLVDCLGIGCRLSIVIFLKKSDLSETMFFLMLKQMVPDIAVGDYLEDYLDIDDDLGPLLQEEESRISLFKIYERIGSISFQSVRRSDCHDSANPKEKIMLGFTIMPGIKTENGCNGFDQWLQFLFCEYYNRINNICTDMKKQLLGPRPHPVTFFR